MVITIQKHLEVYHYRYESVLTDTGVSTDFTANNNDSIKFKQKLSFQTGADSTINV